MALVDLSRLATIFGESLSGAGGGGALQVRDASDVVSDSDVTVIRVSDGTLSINAPGDVSIVTGAGAGEYPIVTSSSFASDDNTANLGVRAIYQCTSTAAPRTFTVTTASIEVPAAGEAWFFTVKDVSGGAGTNPITIVTQGSETIDGVGSVQITEDFGSISLFSDGNNLFSR